MNQFVEFEKSPVELRDVGRIIGCFRGIYRVYSNLTKEKLKGVNM